MLCISPVQTPLCSLEQACLEMRGSAVIHQSSGVSDYPSIKGSRGQLCVSLLDLRQSHSAKGGAFTDPEKGQRPIVTESLASSLSLEQGGVSSVPAHIWRHLLGGSLNGTCCPALRDAPQ